MPHLLWSCRPIIGSNQSTTIICLPQYSPPRQIVEQQYIDQSGTRKNFSRTVIFINAIKNLHPVIFWPTFYSQESSYLPSIYSTVINRANKAPHPLLVSLSFLPPKNQSSRQRRSSPCPSRHSNAWRHGRSFLDVCFPMTTESMIAA